MPVTCKGGIRCTLLPQFAVFFGKRSQIVYLGRCIVPVLHCVASLWLIHADGITPHHICNDVFPILDANGLEDSSHTLLKFLCLVILHTSNNEAAPVDTTCLMHLAHYPTLFHHCHFIIAHLLPTLKHTQTIQHNLIAQGLGIIAHQQ